MCLVAVIPFSPTWIHERAHTEVGCWCVPKMLCSITLIKLGPIIYTLERYGRLGSRITVFDGSEVF